MILGGWQHKHKEVMLFMPLNWILGTVIVWALGTVSFLVFWMLYRTDKNHQRSLDCLMSLMDKEAAVISTSVERARNTPAPDKKQQNQIQKAKRISAARNKILERIEHTGVVTDNDTRDLEALS